MQEYHDNNRRESSQFPERTPAGSEPSDGQVPRGSDSADGSDNVLPFRKDEAGTPIKRATREVDVVIVRHERFRFGPQRGGQEKLVLVCKLIDADLGKEIRAYYRLNRVDGRGRCWAGKRSNIVRDFGRLLPDYVDEMPLPLRRLKGIQARAKTAWVLTAADGEPLAQQQQYERIKCFLVSH